MDLYRCGDLAQEGEGAQVVEEQEGFEVEPVPAEGGVVGEGDVLPLKIDVCLKKIKKKRSAMLCFQKNK